MMENSGKLQTYVTYEEYHTNNNNNTKKEENLFIKRRNSHILIFFISFLPPILSLLDIPARGEERQKKLTLIRLLEFPLTIQFSLHIIHYTLSTSPLHVGAEWVCVGVGSQFECV